MKKFSNLVKFFSVATLFLLILVARPTYAQVVIYEPNGSTEYDWSPNVSWGGYNSSCEYAYDESTYYSSTCEVSGGDIPAPPDNGSYTLYVRGTDGSGFLSYASFSFDFQGYGCTDSNALNYNSSATIDNSSCYYIAINSPGNGDSISSWNPSVSWGNYSPSTCQYSYDNSTWSSADCGSGGSDISSPSSGSVTLYVQASGSIGPYSTSASFTYSPIQYVNFVEPTESSFVTSWNPSVSWGDFSSSCDYSYDNSNWNTLNCSSNGTDISSPGSYGTYTLYARGYDGSSYSTASVSFTYDPGNDVYGCTDSSAINYNSSANIDDSSCYYISISAPSGSVTSWSPSVNFGVNANSCEYSHDNSSWYSVSCGNSGSDIPDNGYGDYTLYVRSNGGSAGSSVNTSSSYSYSSGDVYGCTDSLAINYDSGANVDDGSCYYIQISSPTDGETVSSWNPSVNFGNFGPSSCEYSYNNSNWTVVSCSNAGSDIEVPEVGSRTLYVRSSGTYTPYTFVSFTYSPIVSVSISSPTASQTVVSWHTSVSWGDYNTTCEYSYDASVWINVSCSDTGAEFSAPSEGSATLYIRGTDGNSSQSNAEVSFTYNPISDGCTNNLALNYNPNAEVDDGSCYYIDITSPTIAEDVTSWSPVVNWGIYSPTLCEYRFNGAQYAAVNCSNAGSDIAVPNSGYNVLDIRASNSALGRGPYNDSIYFTYIESTTITSPTSGQTVATWNPVIDWGSYGSSCEYSYDGVTYYSVVGCTNSAIPEPPQLGNQTLYVRGSDGSNYSDAYVGFTYTPITGTPSQPDLDPLDDSGISESDNITSQTSDLTISGVGTDGTVVSICKGGCTTEVVGSVTISGSSWTYDLPTLAEGSHSITVKYQESGKGLSNESSPLVITVDTTAPSAPGTPDLQSAYDTGYSNTDNISSLDVITVTVSCETGTSIQLYLDGSAHRSGTCASGSLSLANYGTLSETTYLFTATQSDAAGNTSEASSALTYVRDATAPTISSVASSTTDVSAVITWTTNENASSTIEYGPTTSYGTASSSAALVTNHSLTVTGLTSQATYNYRVSSTDAAGNRTVSTNRVFVTTAVPDTTSPTVQTAVVNGNTLTLTFTETLSSTSTPATSSFTINGSSVTVTAVDVSGSTMTLTLSGSVASTDTVTLSYVIPLTAMLQDPSGNTVAGFTNRSVTNQTPTPVIETVEVPRSGAAVAVSTSAGFSSFSPAPRQVLVIGTKTTGQSGPAVYVTGVINETTGAPMNNGYGGLTNTYEFNKNATLGVRNDEIVNLQRFLNAQGFRVNTVDGGAGSPGNETNFFGILTRRALAEFQRVVGISPVGYFGPKTRAFINNFLEKNAPVK